MYLFGFVQTSIITLQLHYCRVMCVLLPEGFPLGPEFDPTCVLSKKINIICTRRSPVLGSEKHLFPQKISLRLFVGKAVTNKSVIYCLDSLLVFCPWNYIHQTATAILLFTYFLPLQDSQCDDHELGDQKPSQWSCLGVA